jgi:hypothetical protein
VPVKSIQLGQLWRHEQSGELYLVTKLYSEVFSQFAMLRRAGAQPTAESVRVKVQKGSDGASLPGYTFAQQSQDF